MWFISLGKLPKINCTTEMVNRTVDVNTRFNQQYDKRDSNTVSTHKHLFWKFN